MPLSECPQLALVPAILFNIITVVYVFLRAKGKWRSSSNNRQKILWSAENETPTTRLTIF